MKKWRPPSCNRWLRVKSSVAPPWRSLRAGTRTDSTTEAAGAARRSHRVGGRTPSKRGPPPRPLITACSDGVLIAETLQAAQSSALRRTRIAASSRSPANGSGATASGRRAPNPARTPGQGLLQRQAQIKTLEAEVDQRPARSRRRHANAGESAAAGLRDAAAAVARNPREFPSRAGARLHAPEPGRLARTRTARGRRQGRQPAPRAQETVRRCDEAAEQLQALERKMEQQAGALNTQQQQRHDLAARVEESRAPAKPRSTKRSTRPV